MNNLLDKNKKGIVLVSWYFVLVVLLGLSAVAFMRSTSNLRLAQRNRYAIQAFCEAEAGLNYAYIELSRQGFSWYTHEDNDTMVSSATPGTVEDSAGTRVDFKYPVPVGINVGINPAAIDPDSGCYYVNDADGNRRFQVKSYPERNDDESSANYGNFTDVVVVLSQAEVNGLRRTIEYRLDQKSVYEYFFFFSDDHNFTAATFDGRNYGGIHVNGDINLAGWPDPKFYFLTKLTSGSNLPDKGFILRPRRRGFPDLHGEINYGGSASYPFALSWLLYSSTNSRFALDTTYIRTGEYPQAGIPDQYVQTRLYPYLDANLYPGAEWSWDRYDGDGSNTTPAHYNITDQNLNNLALYEMCGHRGNISLLDDSNVATISSIGTLGEQTMFETMYNDPGMEEGQWKSFWEQWRENHEYDYQVFHDAGTLTGGSDWERRFFLATYEWGDGSSTIPADGIPTGINREWWEDLSYADDRLSLINDLSPAQIEDSHTGEKLDSYILNTKEQPAAWTAWLAEHNFNEAGENKTLIQDRSQGGRYLDPGDVLSEEHTNQTGIKQRAQDGGIYIGPTSEGAFENPIAATCTRQAQFYNAHRPAAHYERGDPYEPSNLLVLDIYALKQALEDPESELNQNYLQGSFNGIIYIDLEGYGWSWPNDDENADGVMLVNGDILPEGGLSIITPHNVIIKGNYNLDPDGRSEKNRDPDDSEVIARLTDPSHPDYTPHYTRIDNTEYFFSADQLQWQPADIISKRAVYTVSEDFPEPKYMPMDGGYYNQFYDEYYGHVPGQDFVNERYFPTDSWAPAPSETYDAYSRLQQWFSYYRDNNGNPVPLPAQWSIEWVSANWPENKVFSLDTDSVPGPDTYIVGRDLREDVTTHIQDAYVNKYSFEEIHGGDGSQNLDTPSLINKVTKKHIYNMALITPYGASSDVLEYWQYYDPDYYGPGSGRSIDTPRVINGAFIQLPAEFQNQLPNLAYYTRVSGPGQADTFNYESRFGRGAHTSDRPPAGLVFSADSSWREIRAENF